MLLTRFICAEILLKEGKELARHLSRNNALHVYDETSEEVLMTVLRNIEDEFQASGIVGAKKRLDLERTQPDKSLNSRVNRVLQMERVVLGLVVDLLPLGPHFRPRPEFQAGWLAKNIDTVMGVRKVAKCVQDR
jgi:hypothetical protein